MPYKACLSAVSLGTSGFAVAGNFDNCMHIKISDKDWTYMSLCTNDGDVDVPQYVSDMPSEVECAARNAVQWLK